MGMDVYGKAPTSEEGSYFRRSVWGWHPLWELCEDFMPDLTSKVKYGHTNDGDGLGAADSVRMADVLVGLLDAGKIREYCKLRDETLEGLPDETCRFCGGTGTRTDKVGVDLGYAARSYCNGCAGRGKVRPWATHYGVTEEDVVEWVAFLRSCGGFSIC